MYLQDSVNLGSDIDNEFNRMGVEKGFSKEEAVSGHNSNVGTTWPNPRVHWLTRD